MAKGIYISGIALLLLTSCLKKPKACLELDEYYEVGREYSFESCSDNYDFITWDFGDSTAGFIGDIAPHTFSRNGQPVMKLTAYANGAYRSDEVKQAIKASRRYIDRIEVTGGTNYNKFRFTFDQFEFINDSVSGNYSAVEPYIWRFWPEQQYVIPINTIRLKLVGERFTKATLVDEDVNFETDLSNPVELQGLNGFVIKFYWTYAL
ncbi:MAG: hypothetical protein R2813_12785 [Flavobacteriales bacterium]